MSFLTKVVSERRTQLIHLKQDVQLPTIKELLAYIKGYAYFANRPSYMNVLYEQTWKGLEALGEDHEPRHQPELIRFIMRTKLYHLLEASHFSFERHSFLNHLTVKGAIHKTQDMKKRVSDGSLPYPREFYSLGEIRFPMQRIDFDSEAAPCTESRFTSYLVYSCIQRTGKPLSQGNPYYSDVLLQKYLDGVIFCSVSITP